ncbi:hypothetical protein [Pseudomonas aeruginosa]
MSGSRKQVAIKENEAVTPKIVYVIGAGLSAGLGFPTINNLLPRIWHRLERTGLAEDIGRIIRFHYPSFDPSHESTFPNIEQLLSLMQANEQLFSSSRPATGSFTSVDLRKRRQGLLLEIALWFHELQRQVLDKPAAWLLELVYQIKQQEAQVISFNWDLLLDELLFGADLRPECYGFGGESFGPRLIKPHGSLNWYEHKTGRYLKGAKKFTLEGSGEDEVLAFTEYRAPKSTKRKYMPLIVPPVYTKQFQGGLFAHLWRTSVDVLSVASEVRFLGYSMAPADFHARFILRCGFHNQEEGVITRNGKRAIATGRSRVEVVDLDKGVPDRIQEIVGWPCVGHVETIEDWVESRFG